jgi:uncharacterized DUF497 family protein
MYLFEWSARKAASNERKHGISFGLASEAFDDPFSLTIPDPDHSRSEERHVLIGCTRAGEILVVVHALRGETIRLISARRATATERTAYEEA